MAYSSITKPTDYFNTKLYTGNGSTQNITGVGFQPDWTWIKARAASGTGNDNHSVCDIVRTKGSYGYPSIYTNLTSAEYNPASGNEVITDFISDGFALGGNENSNYNSNTYVSWNWKAGGSGSSNTDGSITSTVSANQTAGFSIVKYTGTGSGATIGHGLNSELGMLIVKKFESGGQAGNWTIWHKGLTSPQHDEVIFLNSTGGEADVSNDTYWNGANPTLSVFSVNTNENLNENTYDYIAYCFAEKKGYSKFGSYTGNGNADGPFIYLGFKPKYFLLKNATASSGSSGQHWQIADTVRHPENPVDANLIAESNSPDGNTWSIKDFLSNGVKIRGTNFAMNTSGDTYIYMAFAEEPLVANVGQGIPATAR